MSFIRTGEPAFPQPYPPQTVDRGTMMFLTDSISLAIKAEHAPSNDFESTFSRASIISTTLFIEASANACLDILMLDRTFARDVDRLPVISKFELVAKLSFPKRPLKRSRHEIQSILELKQIRDSFIHPKSQKIIWDSWSPDGGSSSSPRTKELGLPKIASYCCFNDAVIAMKATHKFMCYFFREICKFGPSRVSALLMSEDAIPHPKNIVVPYWERATHRWLKSKGVDLTYIEIGSF